MALSARRIGTILIFGALLSGCAGGSLKTDHTIAQERVQAYLAANPSLDPAIASAIGRMQLHKDMTKEQIIAAWGKPAYIQQYSAKTEQWFFGCGWPHSCESPDEDADFPLPDEIFNSRAIFSNGKLSEWNR